MSANAFDLGLFVSKTKHLLDPEMIDRLLIYLWTLSANYEYSEKLQGALCKYCVVFTGECVGIPALGLLCN